MGHAESVRFNSRGHRPRNLAVRNYPTLIRVGFVSRLQREECVVGFVIVDGVHGYSISHLRHEWALTLLQNHFSNGMFGGVRNRDVRSCGSAGFIQFTRATVKENNWCAGR